MDFDISQQGFMVEAGAFNERREELAHLLLLLPSPSRPHAILRAFQVVSRVKNTPGAEKYKGLGKQLLCHVIGQLVREGKLKPETSISLEASGGKVPEGFACTEPEQDVDAFLAKYPEALATLKHDAVVEKREITLDDKRRLAETIRQNHCLVAYYETYGFKVVEDKGESAEMKGTIGGILRKCQSGGRRKTRRRRSTRKRRA